MKAQLTRNFIKTCHGLFNLGLEFGSSGNLSFIDDNSLIITPTGTNFGEISVKNISFYNLDSASYSGSKPSSDLEFHKNIFLIRKNFKVVLHTHSHYITLAAMVGSDVPVLNTMHADYFGRPIKCVPFSNHRKNGFGNMESFNDGDVFLLEKHGGLIIFGELDAKKIINSVRAFEEICRLYCEYRMLNIETGEMSEEDLSIMHKYYKNSYGN